MSLSFLFWGSHHHVPGRVSPNHNGEIMCHTGAYGKSASGFSPPMCGNKEDEIGGQIGAAVGQGNK
jgi:hypothetical protein